MKTQSGAALPSGTPHRVRSRDDVWLEVREWGDPSGPEVLLVPGVAQSYLSFAKQYTAPELADCRIVSFDPRGHGLSDKPLGERYYREGACWSSDVQAVIDALDLRRPVLAGWSLGGRIARQYLLDYGDAALSGVVFISCRPVELPEVVGAGNAIMQTLRVDDLASRIEVATGFLRACYERQPPAEEFAFALAFNMLCPFEIRLQIGGWLTDPAVSAAALRRVRVPVLIQHGTADRLVLPRAAEITAGLIPHAELSLYEGCGHSVFAEAPERFNQELARFARTSWAAATRGS